MPIQEKQRAWQQTEGDIQKGRTRKRNVAKAEKGHSKTLKGQHFRGISAGAGGGGCELEEGTEPAILGSFLVPDGSVSTAKEMQGGHKCRPSGDLGNDVRRRVLEREWG